MYTKGNQALVGLAEIESSVLQHWEYPDDYEMENDG